MPEFKYTASNNDGVITSGTMVADNEEEVMISLKRLELTLINLKVLEEAGNSFSDKYFNKVSNTDKAQFLEYFASMLVAGLSVSDVLQAFYEDLDKPLLRKFVKDTQFAIRNGKQLSDAFAAYPDLFPQMFVGMIKVGEASGTLALSLTQLAEQLKKENELKAKVKNAMIYPTILITALVSVVVILLVVVFPRLEEFFGNAGMELPPLTLAVLSLSKLFTSYWYILAGLGVIWAIIYRRFKDQRNFKLAISNVALRVPIFGPINRSLNVALFARTFGSLLKSGVNILEAADVVQKSLTNQVYIDIVEQIKEDLSKGNSIADSMKKHPNYFSPFEIRVLYISDRTGTTAEGLQNIASFYETRLFTMLGGLSSAIEPVILLAMGVVVAIVAVSVITPIYGILGGVDKVPT